VNKHDDQRLEESVQATEGKACADEEIHQAQRTQGTFNRIGLATLQPMRSFWFTQQALGPEPLQNVLPRRRTENRLQEI